MNRTKLRLAVAAVGAVCAASSAWAADTPFDMKGCLANETTVLDKVGELTVGMNVTRGTISGGGTGEIHSPYPRGANFGASCWHGRGTYTLIR